jgi:hypothetical protein
VSKASNFYVGSFKKKNPPFTAPPPFFFFFFPFSDLFFKKINEIKPNSGLLSEPISTLIEKDKDVLDFYKQFSYGPYLPGS